MSKTSNTPSVPDIRKEIASICRTFGYEPADVLHIDMRPGELKFAIAELNGNGSKFIDLETGEVAQFFATHKVLT